MKTTNEIVRTLKIKKPNPLVQLLFNFLARLLYYKRCRVSIDRRVDLKQFAKKPVIVVANHSSRMDYAFVNFAMKGRRINFVAAENEFHRSHLKTVFRWAHAIPKKNFVPDITTVKGMAKILKREKYGCVCIFPCGMSTASGAQQPSACGSGKMLKHFGVDVLAVRIHGGYFVSPKFDVRERPGKVEVEVEHLFSPQALAQKSEEEVQRILDDALFTDDFHWNADGRHSYKCDWGCADKLEQLLYRCPKCGGEHMHGSGDEIKCLDCGNGGVLHSNYTLHPFEGSVLPKNLRQWFDDLRRQMRKEVLSQDFCLKGRAQIGAMPTYGYVKDKKIGDIQGEGELTIDRQGLHFDGERDGKPFSLFIPSRLLDTLLLPVDAGFFYTYASGEFLFFLPESKSAAKWCFAAEEVHRVNGGKWQNYPWFDYSGEPAEPYAALKK